MRTRPGQKGSLVACGAVQGVGEVGDGVVQVLVGFLQVADAGGAQDIADAFNQVDEAGRGGVPRRSLSDECGQVRAEAVALSACLDTSDVQVKAAL